MAVINEYYRVYNFAQVGCLSRLLMVFYNLIVITALRFLCSAAQIVQHSIKGNDAELYHVNHIIYILSFNNGSLPDCSPSLL